MIKLTEEQRAAIKAAAEQNAVGAGVGDTLRLLADYAALEAECERLRSELKGEYEQAKGREQDYYRLQAERDALRTQLEAIRAAGGEVVAWLSDKHAFAEKLYAAGWRDHADAQHTGCDELRQEFQRIIAAMAAELEQARGEIIDLHTTMMAAAVEIQEQWSAHCDEEGYGPANLMHRLEHGIASQYGYTAETLVRTEDRLEALRTELAAIKAQEPFIYAHELLDVGGGVWLGCLDEESMRKAHIPGQTGEEVIALYRLPPLAGQVDVPGWVPVSERLPDEHKAEYLCLFDGGHQQVSEWLLDETEGWVFWYGNPTHWMPLPAAPALLATPSMEV